MFWPARSRPATAWTATAAVLALVATLIVTGLFTAPVAEAAGSDLTAPVTATNATSYSQAFSRTDGTVTASYALSGPLAQNATPTQRLPQRGSNAVTFSPSAVGTSVVAQVNKATTAACGAGRAASTVTDCGLAGALTVSFTKPVSNPTLHLVSLGEQQGASAYGAYLRVRSAVTSDGSNAASFARAGTGSSLAVTNSGAALGTGARSGNQVNTTATRPDPQCATTSGISTGPAGCESVAVFGSNLTSITFDVGTRTANSDGTSGIAAGAVDTFDLTLSIPDVATTGSPLSCANGVVYSVERDSGNLLQVDPTTGNQTLVGGVPGGGQSVNGLAITSDGTAAYTVSTAATANARSRIQRYDAVTGVQTTYAGPTVLSTGSIIMGAINPRNGYFFFALNTANGVEVYGFDTATNTPIAGRVALVGAVAVAANGDMAFDSDGRLYIAATSGNGTATANPLFLVPGAFPATGNDTRITAKFLAYLSPNSSTFVGVAFSGDFLYASGSYVSGPNAGRNFISTIDPSNGAIQATRDLSYGGTPSTTITDLGSCQTPNPLRARADIVNRVDADDEFTVQVSSATPAAQATGTTSGGRTGLRDDPPETAGPLLATAGRTYTATQTPGNPTTTLADYAVTYACTRNDDATVVTGGTGNTATFTYPTPSSNAGIGVTCVFTDQASALTLTKTNPATLTANQVATYTFGVRNSGPSTARGATVVDRLPPGLAYVSSAGAGWSCAAGTATGTGQPVTCTFTGTVAAGATDTGLTITARPNPTAAGTTVTNRAAVDPSGGTTPPDPSGCTATGTPAGCAVAPAQTVSDAVTAGDDTDATTPATAVTTDVKANDTTASGVPLTAPTVTAAPGHGSTTVTPAGQVVYTPERGFAGTDTYRYRVCSTRTPSACATATVTVTVANAVTANDDAAAVDQNGSVTTAVLANDTVSPGGPALDPASVRVITTPANGVARANPDGTVTYTPTPGFTGTDSYRYTVCDTAGSRPCPQARVAVTVRSGVVVAADDDATTVPGQATTIAVRANDSSSTGQALANPTIVTAPGRGAAKVDPDGTITYTPNPRTSGVDTFTYRVCDTSSPAVCAEPATVTVTVQNTVQANPDRADTPQNRAVRLDVLANDTVAPSGAPLDPSTVTVTVAPARGSTAVDRATGALTYTPAPGASGKDSFTYRVCDTSTPTPTCDSTTATVIVAANVVTARDDADATTPGHPVTTDVRANDTSASGQAFANPTITRAPGRGTVVVNPDGTVTYTPAPGFSGVDTYRYRVCDTGTPATCQSAEVTITVPDAVDAVDDTDTVAQNGTVSTDVLANDTTTPGGAPLEPGSITITASARHASATPVDGRVAYVPDPGYSGLDSYRYRVCDTSSPTPVCDEAIVTLTVSGNTVAAVDDTATTAATTPVAVTVLANDTSASGQALADPTIVTRPANGQLGVGADRRITYTPDPGFSGADSFVYRVCDTGSPAACGSATVTVTVTDDVTATDDTAATGQNTRVTVGVLANDTTTGAPLRPASVTVARDPVHGTATPNADGTVTYAPATNYSGPDSFDYQVCDDATPTTCRTATVSVTVGDNTVRAVDDPATTPQNAAVNVTVLGNDTTSPGGAPLDPGSVSVGRAPAHGTAAPTGDGSVTYTPARGFTGRDTFTYTVYDTSTPDQRSGTATVTVDVGTNTVVAGDDAATTDPGRPVTVPVLGNDSSSTGQELQPPTIVRNPGFGTATVEPDGRITYTPRSGSSGVDTFGYELCDSSTPTPVCARATVTVTVPSTVSANDDDAVVDQNSAVRVVVLGNDTTTPDGAPLDPASVSVTRDPVHGSATANPDGTLTYTPARGYTGADTFGYRVCDTSTPDVNCGQATVTMTVGPDTVVANPDAVTSQPGHPVTIAVRANDTTSTGQPLANPTLTGTGPTKGSVVANDDATITYSPTPGTSGTDSFGYRVCDTGAPAVCDETTVTVTVGNTVSARPDTAATPQNTAVTIRVLDNDSVTPDGAPLDRTSITTFPVRQATVVANPDGTVTFTPDPGVQDVISFFYTVCDTSTPTASCGITSVTVIVGYNSLAPNSDVADTVPGREVSIDVLANDTSSTGQPFADPTVDTQPSGGSARVEGNRILYTPFAGTSGEDRFYYRVCDTSTPDASCGVAQVSVRVRNTVTAADDVAATAQNTARTVDVLANDGVTPGGAPLDRTSVSVVDDPTHGTVTTDGETVRYEPAAGYSGTDTFTYRVCDSGSPATCDTAVVTMTVQAGAVTAGDDTAATDPLQPVSVDVLANDSSDSGQPLSDPVVATRPAHGAALVQTDRQIAYTPARGFSGTDTFTYRVCDTGTPPACATATVTVLTRNTVTARPDTAGTPQNTPVTVGVLGNDETAGAPLDPASVRVAEAPANATARVNPDGTVTVTPADTFSGRVSFSYTVCDTATPSTCADPTPVTVTVATNTVEAVADEAEVAQNGSVTTDVLANDTTAGAPFDLDRLAVTTPPQHGSTSRTAQARIVYTPTRGYSGADSYVYEICDRSTPTAVCRQATVGVTVATGSVLARDDSDETPPITPTTVLVLDNDSAPSGQELGPPSIATPPRGGDVVVQGDGIRYTPRAGFSGGDSFTYRVCDTGDTPVCATATVRISVVNAVVANPDDVTVAQNRGTRIQPWDNDTYSSGGAPLDPQSVQVVSRPSHGRVDLNPDGSVVYTPTPGYSGPDTADYRVCDTGSPRTCATAPVRITVSTNTVIARDDTADTAAGTPVVVDVRGNDESASGQPLGLPTLQTPPRHGQVTVGPDGRMRYAPAAGSSGADTFTYRVCDTGTPPQCATATVTVQVGAAVAPTTATDDAASTRPATAVTVDVRANDRTGTGPLRNPTLGQAPRRGRAAVNPDGTVLYTPARGFSGADTFTYTVCDSAGPPTCASATVTVAVPNTVTPADDVVAVGSGGARRTPVLANDTVSPGGAPLDPRSVTVTTAPQHGTAVPNPDDGSITYTPQPSYSGEDSYVYQVCDTSDPAPICKPASVSIQVRPGVVAANDDVRTTTPVTAVSLDPRDNDSSSTGRPLTAPGAVTRPAHGSVTVAGDGRLTYAPARGFSGTDTFSYTVCDSSATTECDTAQVRIRVVNTVIANPDAARTFRDVAVALDLLANDTTAPGGAPLATTSVIGPPAHGRVTLDPGHATYTPAKGYTGPDNFTYRVCDGSVPDPVCAESTVRIEVEAPAVTPVADAGRTAPGRPITIRVLANDRSRAGFAVPTVVRAPGKGRAVVNDDKTVTYTPDRATSGVDTFDYRVCDDDAPTDCAVTTVTVTVANSVTARTDVARTTAATPVTTTVLDNDEVLPDAAPLDPASVTIVGGPAHGRAVAARDATITYTPAAGFSGQDTYRYRVCDRSTPDPVCAAATVTVDVDGTRIMPGPPSPPKPPAPAPGPIVVIPPNGPARVLAPPPSPVVLSPAPTRDPAIVTVAPDVPRRRAPLAFTGAVVAPAAGIGLAALAIGTALVLLGRRRRR